ncbi:SMP-30/gluconolactonase/LRE family protein [Streptomyces halobius]|uniref:Uncharacterized protein n=1 Tax=Streptomyces halobius TaxID=2879846 RepID=A0ABY4M7R8_9ACTN|nr:hypothetical protein [Streptomyces halobius]UQA93728.1 hypothetical protein K9S39_19320 [Streptomyces halobius]
MASRRIRSALTVRAAVCCTSVLVLSLSACTSDSAKKNAPIGIPTPKLGKVVPFNLTTEHHATQAAGDPLFGEITAGRSGDFYMSAETTRVNGIVRVSSDGKATSLPAPGPADDSPQISGMTTTPDGDLLVGKKRNIYRLTPSGKTKAVIKTNIADPGPMGVRPDGAIVIESEGSLWSIAHGKTSLLYKGSVSDEENLATLRGKLRGALDTSGTVYAAVGRYLPDIVVIPQGKKPHRWGLRGNVPGTSVPLSTLTPLTLAQAHDGGVYILAATGFPTSHHSTGYVLYVKDDTVKLATKAPFTGKSNSCSPGKEYSVDHVPCILPWYVVESGNRLLLLGNHKADSRVVPLALRAVTK